MWSTRTTEVEVFIAEQCSRVLLVHKPGPASCTVACSFWATGVFFRSMFERCCPLSRTVARVKNRAYTRLEGLFLLSLQELRVGDTLAGLPPT